MAIDGEPKNGDFVRYIEMLDRQAGSTPGQVLPRSRRGVALNKRKAAPSRSDRTASAHPYTSQAESTAYPQVPGSDDVTTPYSYTPSTSRSAPAYPRNASPGATRDDNHDDQESTTLAARGGQRHLSLALAIAGAIALWNAMDRLISAVHTDNLDVDSLIPVVFLMICAWMLFKGARGARRKQNKPLAKLPPLTTVHMGRKPKN